MAKVFSMHYLELHSGVNAEDFERFVTEEVYPATVRQDLTISVLKGERGERLGKYMVIFEFESVAARNRYWPAWGEPSEAGRSFAGQWFEKLGTFATLMKENFTSYIVVGK